MEWDPVWRLYRTLGGLFHVDIRECKVLDIAIDKVSGALSMHAVPPAIQIVCGTHKSDSPIRAL
jgi:hypothetical protein